MIHLKGHLRFHFKKQKVAKKCEEKDVFDIVVDNLLDNAIKEASLNIKCGSLRILYILYNAEETELLTF